MLWKKHELVLTQDGWKKCKEEMSIQMRSTLNPVPFVVAIDRKPIYLGFIINALCCEGPPDAPSVSFQGIQKEEFTIWSKEGLRYIIENKELHDYLAKHNKLKE